MRPNPRFSLLHEPSTNALTPNIRTDNQGRDSPDIYRLMQERNEVHTAHTEHLPYSFCNKNLFRLKQGKTVKALFHLCWCARIAHLRHDTCNICAILVGSRTNFGQILHFSVSQRQAKRRCAALSRSVQLSNLLAIHRTHTQYGFASRATAIIPR